MIKLIDVSRRYGNTSTCVNGLNNVSLEICKGSFTAIFGESGSGKTTLMNILGCLDVQDEGKYYLDGIDVSALSANEMSRIRNRKLGYIFQNFNLIPHMSALENVELPMIYRKMKKAEREEKARAALKTVGLESRASHRPTQLSGGQQQRVAIARAIVTDPSILLADEPCGNLDSKASENVMSILENEHRRGKTVILITHSKNDAERAERIFYISDGKMHFC